MVLVSGRLVARSTGCLRLPPRRHVAAWLARSTPKGQISALHSVSAVAGPDA